MNIFCWSRSLRQGREKRENLLTQDDGRENKSEDKTGSVFGIQMTVMTKQLINHSYSNQHCVFYASWIWYKQDKLLDGLCILFPFFSKFPHSFQCFRIQWFILQLQTIVHLQTISPKCFAITSECCQEMVLKSWSSFSQQLQLFEVKAVGFVRNN